jgi:hypothetical protein
VVVSSDISVWVELSGDDGVFRVVLEDGTPPDPTADPLEIDWYYKRHYVEFALLGLASRRPGVKAIFPTRGVPDDAWPLTKMYILEYPMVAASWLTAAELQALDWTMPIRFRSSGHPFDVGLTETRADATENNPIIDFDGRIMTSRNLIVMPEQGPEHTDRESFPFVVDVPLIHAAPGLHALMDSTVALRPARPDTVRIVYAFDQE